MKVILDCNILISFLITPGKTIRKIKYFLENDKFDLIISDEIITEIKNVLDRLESRK